MYLTQCKSDHKQLHQVSIPVVAIRRSYCYWYQSSDWKTANPDINIFPTFLHSRSKWPPAAALPRDRSSKHIPLALFCAPYTQNYLFKHVNCKCVNPDTRFIHLGSCSSWQISSCLVTFTMCKTNSLKFADKLWNFSVHCDERLLAVFKLFTWRRTHGVSEITDDIFVQTFGHITEK